MIGQEAFAILSQVESVIRCQLCVAVRNQGDLCRARCFDKRHEARVVADSRSVTRRCGRERVAFNVEFNLSAAAKSWQSDARIWR
jgi:hypothetical protein